MSNLSEDANRNVAQHRLLMTALGASAGLALFVVTELDGFAEALPKLYLLFASATFVLFGVALVLTGPLSQMRALVGACGLAVVLTLLASLLLLRYPDGDAPALLPLHPCAYLLILGVGIPFAASGLQTPGGWRDYARLFRLSWTLVVRIFAACIFTGLVWGLILLASALFDLVGVTIIESVLDWAPTSYLVTGIAFGLAFAVLDEVAAHISPLIVLRVLRLLLPVVTLVLLVFTLALPFQNLDRLALGLSPAATLMVMAWVTVLLITVALDAEDGRASRSGVTSASIRLAGLLIVPLALIAFYAVWLRIDAYGLTPNRLAAAFLAFMMVGYATGYAIVIALRRDWRVRMRNVNLAMALAKLAVAALWMTPLFNAEQLATSSQIARAELDDINPEQLALWEMKAEWGLPGQRGFAQLEAQAENGSPLAEQIARVQRADNRWAVQETVETETTQMSAGELQFALQPLPGSQPLPPAAFAEVIPGKILRMRDGCAHERAGRPACAVYFGNVVQGASPIALVFFEAADARVLMYRFVLEGEKLRGVGGGPSEIETQADVFFAALSAGDVAIVPRQVEVIEIDEETINPVLPLPSE